MIRTHLCNEKTSTNMDSKQDCIPVECVPTAAVIFSPPDQRGHPPQTRHRPPRPDTPLDQTSTPSPPSQEGAQERNPPPPQKKIVDRMTDTCKNITFPILRMRSVIKQRRL